MDWTVCDVALRAPVTVQPETTLADAEQVLIRSNASDLYVVDAHERLLGVVPDYELLKRRLIGGDSQRPVSSLMSPVTVSLTPGASLECGARLLREHIHASVPIVDRGRLIGQLCRANLLRILAEIAAAQEHESIEQSDSMTDPETDDLWLEEACSKSLEEVVSEAELTPSSEEPSASAPVSSPHFLKALFSPRQVDDSRIC